MRRGLGALRARLGMTLMELMVGVAVGSIVLVAVAAISVSQSRSFSNGRRLRERQSSARFALDYLERTVRQAGFAIDPQFAFDFDFYNCQSPEGTNLIYASAACAQANPIRDPGAAPDELVTVSRSLHYRVGTTIDQANVLGDAWVIASAAEDHLMLRMHAGDSLPMGQVLHLMCTGGRIYTYVTVAESVTASAEGEQRVELAAAAETPFRQNGVAKAACLDAGTAIAYKVNRSHFFIFSDTNANLPAEAKNTTGLPRTYLVLGTGTDRNLDNAIDEADLIPIAPDIIDLQLAYVLNNGTVVGDDEGEAELTAIFDNEPLKSDWSKLTLDERQRSTRPFPVELRSDQSFGFFDTPVLFDTTPTSQFRQLTYPGNIRAVRITLIARTSTPMPEGPRTEEFPPGPEAWFENRKGFLLSAAPDGYKPFLPAAPLRERYGYEVVQTTVNIPNLQTSGHFMF